MVKRKIEKFPLTLHHATGHWSKCFTLPSRRRKTVYFGTDRDAALQKYLTERDEWQAGRNPRETPATAAAVTLSDLINAFLIRTKDRATRGEISPVTFGDKLWVGQKLVEHFGRDRSVEHLTPADFAGFRSAMAAKYAPARLTKTITTTRSIFKWGFESELLDNVVRLGPDFKGAGKRLVRQRKAEAGAKLLTPKEINSLLKHANDQMKAVILLGVNCGLGNTDIGALPISALDLDDGILDFPRPKTGIARRVPLWPETVKALRKVLKTRKPRAGAEHLVFVNSRGGRLLDVKPNGHRVDQIGPPFKRLAVEAGVHRHRMGFYWLRHCVQTVGDETRDFLAVAAIMGHSDSSTAGHYRESISDDRLRAVTNHLHDWLYAKPKRKPSTPKPKRKPALRIAG